MKHNELKCNARNTSRTIALTRPIASALNYLPRGETTNVTCSRAAPKHYTARTLNAMCDLNKLLTLHNLATAAI